MTTAAALFKMPTSKVRSPKPIEEATAGVGEEGASEGAKGEELVTAAAKCEISSRRVLFRSFFLLGGCTLIV